MEKIEFVNTENLTTEEIEKLIKKLAPKPEPVIIINGKIIVN